MNAPLRRGVHLLRDGGGDDGDPWKSGPAKRPWCPTSNLIGLKTMMSRHL